MSRQAGNSGGASFFYSSEFQEEAENKLTVVIAVPSISAGTSSGWPLGVLRCDLVRSCGCFFKKPFSDFLHRTLFQVRTDCHRSYRHIGTSRCREDVTHLTVNHSENFKDPVTGTSSSVFIFRLQHRGLRQVSPQIWWRERMLLAFAACGNNCLRMWAVIALFYMLSSSKTSLL